MPLKQAPIKPGSDVYWLCKIRPDMAWVAKLHAKVLSINDDIAVIETPTDCTYGSPRKQLQVLLSELESKSYEPDRSAEINWKAQKRSAAEVVKESEWDGIFIDADRDQYFDSSDDYLEHCECNDLEPYDFMFCVKVSDYVIESDLIVNSMDGDFDDYTIENLQGLSELDQAFTKFCQLNNLKSYDIVYSKIIEVKPDATTNS